MRRSLLSTLLLCTSALGWFGVEQRFKEERLIATGSLGLPANGLVVAFGDFNSDQLLDLFFLSADQRTLSVFTWDRPAYAFKERESARIRTNSDFIITNVVPGDFDYDGKLDLLLMGAKNPGGWWGEDGTVDMQLYLQRTDGTFCQSTRYASLDAADSPRQRNRTRSIHQPSRNPSFSTLLAT